MDQQHANRGRTTLDEAAEHFSGSAVVSRKIRPEGDPEHGRHAKPCRSCAALLERLGIEVLDG
nr:YwqJ-related putative deaminase [Streptomyces sp. 2231.1]